MDVDQSPWQEVGKNGKSTTRAGSTLDPQLPSQLNPRHKVSISRSHHQKEIILWHMKNFTSKCTGSSGHVGVSSKQAYGESRQS